MAKIKIAELAKEIGAPAKDVMSYLREKGVDVKSYSSLVDDDGIKIAEDFFGVRKERKTAPAAEPKRRALFDADGKPIKRKFDENGKPLPITGPVFDADGKPVQVRKQLFDAEGNPIKRKVDANGNPLPITGPVFDADGNPVQLRKRTTSDSTKEIDKETKKPTAPVVDTAPAETEKPVKAAEEAPAEVPAVVEKKPVVEPSVTPKKPIVAESDNKTETPTPERKPRENTANDRKPREGQNNGYSDRKPRDGAQGQGGYGDRRPRDGQNGGYGDRKPRDGAQGQGSYGDRRPRDGQNGGYGDRRPRDGAQGQGSYGDRRPRDGQGNSFGDRRPRDGAQGQGGFRKPAGNNGGFGGRGGFDKGGFDKGGFDKDREGERKVFTKKNDQRSGGSAIKADFSNEITKEQRASAFNDRNRDKNRKGRDFDSEVEGQGKKGSGKKKDPNRKGAFIMPKPVQKVEEDPNEIKTIVIGETITIKELADKMKQNASVIVKKLFLAGKMVNLNSDISYEEAEEIAIEYNCIVEKEEVVDVVEELMRDTEDTEDTLMNRPPVVCVMGHVDHGKTSILDAIRSTHVTQREAGGITQHIGAYMVEKNGQPITFLDTPGHEAFTAMRMRGAMATDIAVLVVAADDGVMPQTIEAINHAKAAGVSIVVAINKMDKEAANPDRVLTELSEHGLISESWGGDIVTVPVSAKTGEGIDQLLEMILLTAEVLELKSNPNRKARGIVIEAKLDKGRGPVATVLVQKGTLRVGDTVAIGASYGKIRAMINDQGEKVAVATPSTPVEILGLNSVPGAGDILVSTENEKEARNISEAFVAQSKERLIADTKAKLSLDGLFDQIQAGNVKELNIIVKADVAGSVEAVKQSLTKLSNEEVAVRCIHGGVGNINESDVILASASSAIIIGFNVKPDNVAKDTAEREQVDIRLYSVIYNAIDDIEAAMKGMLDPIYEEVIIGHAEIRQIFKASGLGNIAGSYVLDGKITRGSKARISRGGEQIFDGNIASLKRGKDDVKDVNAGYECGMVFEKFNDIQELDAVEIYIMQEVPRK